MIKWNRLILFTFFCLALTFSPSVAWSQLVLGQYEDEAPVRSWNTFGFASASSLSLGGAVFAYGEDCSAGLSNPSLLTSLPRTSFTLSGSYSYASLFRYAMVNTGVLRSDGNLSLRLLALDFAGISFRLQGWSFSLSASVPEIYDRPKVAYTYSSQGTPLYRLNFNQTGTLKNIHLSVARQLFPRFAAGVGFNVVFGNLDKTAEEQWTDLGITITDQKNQTFRGTYLNAGITYALTDSLTAALVLRTPFAKKAKNRSQLQYAAQTAQTDIMIKADSEDSYHQPLVAGFGFNWRIAVGLRAVSDIAYCNWSRYKASYFEEEMRRAFRDVVQMRVGLEYLAVYPLFGTVVRMPVRVGFQYDPLPMKEPRSAYAFFSFGTGIHWKHVHLDAGTSLGKENGSGNSLVAQRIAVSLSFEL